MNKIITFSIIGKNKVNTIPKLYQNLYTNNVNILKSQLINMTDSFILHADAEVNHKICINNILNNYSNFVIINPKQIYYNSNMANFKISVKNCDEPGIIHNTTKILSERNINICKINSYISTAPISGQNIFNLNTYIYNPYKNLELQEFNDLNYEYQIMEIKK